MAFKPFADDAGALTLGGLTVENGTDAVSFSGEVTRDREGLAHARRLAEVVAAIVADLEGRKDLPARVDRSPGAPAMVANPFGTAG